MGVDQRTHRTAPGLPPGRGLEIGVSSVGIGGYRTRIVVVIAPAPSAAESPLREGRQLHSGIGLRVEPHTVQA
jgi:hypothetical protein